MATGQTGLPSVGTGSILTHMDPVKATELGLPSDDVSGSSLLYCPGADALVLGVRIPAPHRGKGRVYVRQASDRTYLLVGDPAEAHSDESVVTDGDRFRATLVTLSLANGKTDDWVRARTLHAGECLRRYRRMAQSEAELNLGNLSPLCDAIPELARMAPSQQWALKGS